MQENQLKELIATLNAIVNPSSASKKDNDGSGLGFVEKPEEERIQFLFPDSGGESLVGLNWIFPGTKVNGKNVPNPVSPASGYLNATLLFINITDTITGGVEKQKCQFWMKAGNGITYVLQTAWDNGTGNITNTTESFLKELSALTDDEIQSPITISLIRLTELPNFTPDQNKSPFANNVIFVNVWTEDGRKIVAEGGEVNAANGADIILRINQLLTGKKTLTPREKRQKNQNQNSSQVPQTPVYQPPAPAPTPVFPIFPDTPQRISLIAALDNHTQQYLGGDMAVQSKLLQAMFPGRNKRPYLNDLELQAFYNEFLRLYPVPAPQQDNFEEDTVIHF